MGREFARPESQSVRRGRKELHAGEMDPNRVRKPGGGRHSLN